MYPAAGDGTEAAFFEGRSMDENRGGEGGIGRDLPLGADGDEDRGGRTSSFRYVVWRARLCSLPSPVNGGEGRASSSSSRQWSQGSRRGERKRTDKTEKKCGGGRWIGVDGAVATGAMEGELERGSGLGSTGRRPNGGLASTSLVSWLELRASTCTQSHARGQRPAQ